MHVASLKEDLMIVDRKFIFPILIILCILLNSIPGIWDMGYIPGTHRKWYYVLDAISWLPAAISIKFYTGIRTHRCFLEVFILVVINNIMDELLFDPIHLNWNELVFLSLIIVWTILRYGKFTTRA